MHLLQVSCNSGTCRVRHITVRVSILASPFTHPSSIVPRYLAQNDPQTILLRLPKNEELLRKWLLAIGKTERKICESSRICSRHFKEDDFRYSVVGGKRFLKRGAIPSLYLNEESKDDGFSDNRDKMNTMDNKSLNIVTSQDAKKDNQLSYNIRMKVQTTAKDTCENTEFVAGECYEKIQMPERISASLLDSSSNESEKKYKKHLYDVRWEEISTSPVQAKIYWEVAIKRIMRQKVILRSLRQKVKRLKKTILELRTRVKKVACNDLQ